MSTPSENLLPGITSRTVDTPRLRVNVLEHRPESAGGGVPVVFVHGNCSSSLFWQPLMRSLPGDSLAIDLRGFGDSETKPVDATRGS